VTQRRASYGPTSPRVGERGARTRERIVEETLGLFTTLGFHETTVRDIAQAAEVSRATLYQYFESKDDIFVELLEECGDALLNVMRKSGTLAPSAEGFANLRAWLMEWSQVYEKYGTLFLQWSNVDAPGSAVRPMVSNFLNAYNLRIANRFKRSGLTGMDSREAAIVTTSVVHRYNYLRLARPVPHRAVEDAVQDIATVLQMVLFPSTEIETLGIKVKKVSRPSGRKARLSSRPPEIGADNRLAGLTPRSAATVQRIMRAGAQCFAESGYYRASVDDIVTRAGFARGTFYKYFSEKLDLLLVLSDACEAALWNEIESWTAIAPGPAGAAARRQWLDEFLDFRSEYVGVIRTWFDRSPSAEALEQARQRMNDLVEESLAIKVNSGDLAGIVSPRAGNILLIGVLERMPDALLENGRRDKRPEVVELMATVIERGLLGLDLVSDIAGTEAG